MYIDEGTNKLFKNQIKGHNATMNFRLELTFLIVVIIL
jgi:hypothetical protein